MRTVLFTLAAGSALLLGTGCCCSNPASTGWSFQVGRPASMMTPLAVQQTEGPLLIGGVAAGPAAATRATTFAVAEPSPCPPGCVPGPAPLAARGPAALAGQGSCSLDDVCARLERIERELNAPKLAPEQLGRPMPKGGPQE